MIGWLILLAIAAFSAAVLALLRFPWRLWTIPATALMLGAAGYAWQGRPDLAGHPVAAVERAGTVDPGLIALRDAMFGRFNFDSAYFIGADAMTRAGAPDHAVGIMLGGVRKAPQDAALWTILGLKLAEHDGQQLSPPARFAFQRALDLWPTHPGPPYFYGVALVRAGELAEARPYWAEAVARTPANASYRAELVQRLALLDALLASAPAGAQPTP